MKLNPHPVFLIIFLLVFLFNTGYSQKQLSEYQSSMQYDLLKFSRVLRHKDIKNSQPFFQDRSSLAKIPGSPEQNIFQGITGTSYCYDTAGRFLLKTNDVNYYVEDYIWAQDGNLLISGEYYNYSQDIDGGFLMKTDQWGNISWAKLYDSVNHANYSYINYYHLLELMDGSILLAGSTNDPITDNDDIIITKTDKSGNILWSRTYKSRLWRGNGSGSDSYFYIQDIKQDSESGDIFFTGPHWADGRNITRLNINDGNIKWSKVYQQWYGSDFDRPFGIDITKTEILSFSKFITSNRLFLDIYRIDKNSGDTIQTKFFRLSDTSGTKAGILGNDPLKKLSNGHYVISGTAYGYYQYMWDGYTPLYQSSVVEFDNNLDIVNSYSFRNNVESNAQNRVSIYPDGSGLLCIQQYISGFTCNIFYVQFKNNQILKQRRRFYTEGVPIVGYPLQMPDKGNLNIRLLGDTTDNINKIEFLKLHISDTASECLGFDDNSIFMQKVNYVKDNFGFDSIMSADFYDAPNKTLTLKDISLDLLPGCKRISYCDTIKIVPVKDTICVGQDAIFHIRKNPACGATPYFNYDTTGVKSFTQINDSTFNLQFNSTWKNYIHALITTCNVVEDSALLTALLSPEQLTLGNDTIICPGNIINLNAHTGFLSYKWQDNSTDSIFKVTQPGKYYVTATNACGDFFADTVIVSAHPPIPFNAGPDITLCSGDTATITAPSGFINYQWKPDYNISATNISTVKIFPTRDTSYTVSAEKTQGCFAYDTIHTTVKQIPGIYLGNDTSFCENSSVILDAGFGFDNYQWSNGATTQTITVNTTGKFYVTAALNGCSSTDTLTISNVWPLPSFTLGSDTTLCENQQLTYQFNLQNAVYTWSDGNTSNIHSFSQAGTYWLSISQDGCAKSDTVSLSYKLSPTVYLGNDTTLCEATSLLLDATNNNAAYTWQDGSNNPGYFVNKPGKYYVLVNMNDCIAKDTINISYTPIPSFTLGEDLFLCKGIEYKLEPAINTTVDYLWQDGTHTPSFNVNTDGIYTLTASNNCGTFTDSVKITIGICQLQMPSAFTPNGDGNNDVFRVKHPFPVSQFNMSIYNRWGQKIFESADIYKGWDGTYKGIPASMDTYVWIITLTDTEGKKQNAKGTILLMR